ncbi:ChbG/HpnK family deacetylase [Candidatus Woesearchaeota archaeon]|nr:ChbG/HpnK family deacetylase [Candidatus Woesearchaeota archaeon]
MKRLIVTADDFGYSRNVNKAIIRCFKEGIVTSTSLIVNTTYFQESINLLKQNKNLDVGLHINLTEFKPLTKNKTLAGKNGEFIGKTKWFGGYYKNADKKEVEDEIEAQILKAVSKGLKITHINGHNHIHIFPNVIDIILRLAKKYKIRCIRIPNEKVANKHQKLSNELKKRNMLAKFSKMAKTKILKNKLRVTNAFYGILNMNDMNFNKLSMILNSIKNGTSELMTHPAYIDKKGDIFHSSRQRESEIKLMTSDKIMKLIKKRRINLVNFAQI